MSMCLKFCLDFAFKFKLRRYNKERKEEARTRRAAAAGAYTRPLFSSP